MNWLKREKTWLWKGAVVVWSLFLLVMTPTIGELTAPHTNALRDYFFEKKPRQIAVFFSSEIKKKEVRTPAEKARKEVCKELGYVEKDELTDCPVRVTVHNETANDDPVEAVLKDDSYLAVVGHTDSTTTKAMLDRYYCKSDSPPLLVLPFATATTIRDDCDNVAVLRLPPNNQAQSEQASKFIQGIIRDNPKFSEADKKTEVRIIALPEEDNAKYTDDLVEQLESQIRELVSPEQFKVHSYKESQFNQWRSQLKQSIREQNSIVGLFIAGTMKYAISTLDSADSVVKEIREGKGEGRKIDYDFALLSDASIPRTTQQAKELIEKLGEDKASKIYLLSPVRPKESGALESAAAAYIYDAVWVASHFLLDTAIQPFQEKGESFDSSAVFDVNRKRLLSNVKAIVNSGTRSREVRIVASSSDQADKLPALSPKAFRATKEYIFKKNGDSSTTRYHLFGYSRISEKKEFYNVQFLGDLLGKTFGLAAILGPDSGALMKCSEKHKEQDSYAAHFSLPCETRISLRPVGSLKPPVTLTVKDQTRDTSKVIALSPAAAKRLGVFGVGTPKVSFSVISVPQKPKELEESNESKDQGLATTK